MSKPRDYKKEYRDYHGTPEHVKERAQRNKARAITKKKLGAAAIAGKDVDHIRPIRAGGSNAKGNLRVRSPHANRGYEADKKRR